MNQVEIIRDEQLNDVDGGFLAIAGVVLGFGGIFFAGYAVGWQLAEALDKKK